MADTLTTVNQQLVNSITGIDWLNVIGWIFFGAIVVGGIIWFSIWWKSKKLFNKTITAHVQVGDYWKSAYQDTARSVKIGKGGFEILYLKKLKAWKIAYGGNFGDNHYDFYVMPDGYWYNSRQSAKVNYIDSEEGLIPVVTTNPLMRGQYTALEKQVDDLHGQKSSWWEKNGQWVMSISFVLVAGVMLWLMFKEFTHAIGMQNAITQKLTELVGQVSNLISNTQQIQPTGLVPA